MSLLEIRDLGFSYGRRPVLQGVSFDVAAGEAVAVLGPNGSGKSTLLRLISGWLTPDEGTIRVAGEDMQRLARPRAAQLVAAMTADETTPFPFAVEDAVQMGRHPWRGAFAGASAADEAAVGEALAEMSLESLRDRPLPQLSAGERQRVHLARCLAQDGRLLLLDEPTAHLDLGFRLHVLGVLRRRAESGVGVLAALHDLHLAPLAASRILLLVEGRVLADGSPEEVLTPERVEAAFGARVHVVAGPDGPVLVPARSRS